jgi:ribosomal protein S18 acetylase RimI-like enzyme
MKSVITIRLASPADIPAMLPIINDAFAIETFLEGMRTNHDQLASVMRKGECLLGYNSLGELVASVYVEVRGTRGYFGMLAVAPAHQGNGFARAMVEAAEVHCRHSGCTSMDLTVLSLRPELPLLYAKFGYVESGTEEFRPSRPLKDGMVCHCIVMSKPL